MFHYVNNVEDKATGKVVLAISVRIINPATLDQVPVYSDESGTPFAVNGVPTDTVPVNEKGRIDFWVTDGVYDIEFIDNRSQQRLDYIEKLPMTADFQELSTVYANLADIGTVSANMSDVNTVADNMAAINTSNANSANINAVAGNSANINTVAANAASINAVNANSANINAVNANATNINSVATNMADVNLVGGSIADLNAVADDMALGPTDSFILRAPASAALAVSYSDDINLTLVQMMQIQDILGLPTGAFRPEVADSFAVNGNLNGRLTPIRNIAWATEWAPPPATAGNINALSTVSGKMGGTGVSQAARTWGTLQGSVAGIASARIAIAQSGTVGLSGLNFHLSFDNASAGSAKEMGLQVTSSYSADTGSISYSGRGLGGGGGSTTFTNLQSVGCPAYPGDTFTLMTYISGGVTYGRPYLNGQAARPDFQLSGQDFPLTGKHGVNGGVLAGTIEDYSLADPQLDAWLVAYGPARVRQIATDRTSLATEIRALGGHPAIIALYYDLVDEATGNPVTGQIGLRTTNFVTISDTEVSGKTQPIAIGTGTYSISMFRHGLLDTNGMISESRGSTARFKVGDVIANDGQSNSARLLAITTTTGSVTQPALGDSWYLDANPTSLENAQYTRRVSANTALAMAHNTLTAATGRATAHIIAGLSGNAISFRGVGSANHTSILNGMKRSGGSIGCHVMNDGESDALGSSWSTWGSYYFPIIASIEAASGRAIKGVICAIGSGWTTSFGPSTAQADINAHAMRRAQWVVAQSDPTKYGICYKSDQQHATGDALHYNGDGMAEYERRSMIGYAKLLGLSAYDRSGCKMLTASRSGDTVTVNLDLNGGTGLELANSAYAGDFGGGVQFSLSSTFASLLAPTGVSFGAAAGGQQTAIWTFAGGSVTGPVYVRSHWGRNPFNPTDNATINLDMANRASMLRVQYPSEPSIPVAPYFGTNDYLTAA